MHGKISIAIFCIFSDMLDVRNTCPCGCHSAKTDDTGIGMDNVWMQQLDKSYNPYQGAYIDDNTAKQFWEKSQLIAGTLLIGVDT